MFPENKSTLHFGRSLRISMAALIPDIPGITTSLTRMSIGFMTAWLIASEPLYSDSRPILRTG